MTPADRRHFPVIDAHVHLRGQKRIPAEVMRRANLRQVVNINYMSDGDRATTEGFAAALDCDTAGHSERFLSCTTFPLDGFGGAGFADAAIAALEDRFAADPRTVAVKIWKNVGLTLRDEAGRLVQCDDPRFSPVFAWIERRGVPVYLHIGDPIAAWQPLDEASPHYRYYSRNPHYHHHARPGAPSHADLMAAQAALIARWPGIRFIAAHFGALAHDVALVGAFLAAHPNAAVDSSARHADLRQQARERVVALFEAYPDRIIFGSDWSAQYDAMDDAAAASLIEAQCARLAWDFAYFERELALSEAILAQFYHDNARAWLGLAAAPSPRSAVAA